MKVTYGTTPVTLADAADPALSALKINGRRVVQVEPLLRSTTAFIASRANHQTTVTFTCTKLHATLQAAQEFCCVHQSALADDGDLVIWASDGLTSFTLADACLQVCESHAIGVTTITDYSFTGAKLTVTPPEDP